MSTRCIAKRGRSLLRAASPVVAVLLIAGLAPVPASASGEEVGAALNTFDVPPGATVTITFQVTVDNPLNVCAGGVSNQGTLTGANFAPVLTDDPATGAPGDPTVTPLDVADLAVTKTNGTTTSTPGAPTTYTITVTNNGPAAANGATVADNFPAVLTGVTWTCSGTGGATCTAAGSGNISDSVNIPPGGSVTYSATGLIDPGATGNLANSATVTPPVGTTDCAPGNNSATDTDTLAAEADLAISKDDGQASAVPGDPVTYTITVSNAGPSDAVGATVADNFPIVLTGVTWTCSATAGSSCTASGSGDINDTVTVLAGGSVTYSATGTVAPDATGTLDNTATVTAPGGIDPDTSNNSATDSDTLTPTADLSITKDDGVTEVTPGAAVTYTITASNAGPSDVTGATVADSFPPELTCTWTCSGAGGGTCTAAGSGDINDSVDLPPGGSVTYSAACTLSGTAAGTLVNTATVTAPSGVTDPDPGDNTATDTDTIRQLDYGDAPDPAYPTLSASNGARHILGGSLLLGSAVDSEADGQPTAGADGDDTTGVDDEDGVSFTSALRVGQEVTLDVVATAAGLLNAWVDFNGDGDWADAGEQVFSDEPLAPGTNSLAFTVPATAPALASTYARFRASTAGGDGPAGLAADGEVEDYAVEIEAAADLAVTKVDDADPPAPGANLTYTITVDNLGPSDATGVVVTDNLPAGVTLVATSGCAEDPAGAPTCTLGAIPSGGSASYTIEVSIDPSPPASVTNTATAAGDQFDPDTGNNSDSEETTFDAAAPEVDGVDSAGGTGDGSLAECETARTAVTQLLVTFSEEVVHAAAGDPASATNPANYRLVAPATAGSGFDTASCAGGTGGDTVVAIDGVTYNAGTDTATLSLNGGTALADGLYRLLVCGTIEDPAGNPLDGGAGAGTDFVRTFRVDRLNRLADGHFDDFDAVACTLEAWSSTSPASAEIDPTDADGSPLSGSAHNSGALVGFDLSQCVAAAGGLELDLTAKLRVDTGPGVFLAFERACRFFNAAACGGASLGVTSFVDAVDATAGGFLAFQNQLTPPAGTASVRCSFTVDSTGGEMFDAYLDQAFLGGPELIFTDGFESGDTSSWSVTVP